MNPARVDRLLEVCEPPQLGRVEDAWVPSEAEVSAAEDAIRRAYASQKGLENERYELLAADLDAYIRQWVGVTVGHTRLVVLTAVAADGYLASVVERVDWTRDVFDACDGGGAVLRATYDLEAARVASFRFNSPAWSCCDADVCADSLRCECVSERDLQIVPSGREPPLVICERKGNITLKRRPR